MDEEALSAKFFTLKTINDLDVKSVAVQMQKKNVAEHFLLPFVLNKGYILWNDAEKSKSSNGILIILPFSFENAKEINGFIMARQDYKMNTITYDVFSKNNLLSYGFAETSDKLNARKVQSLINYFNYKKFGTNVYKLQDIRLLPDSIRIKYPLFLDKNKLIGKIRISGLKVSNTNLATSMAMNGGAECFGYWSDEDWWYNPDGDKANNNGDEYYAFTVSTYHISYCFDWGGGRYGGTDLTENSTSSGGGVSNKITNNYDPNNPFKNIIIPIDADDDEIIDNGIYVCDNTDAPNNPKIVAQTTSRGNTEDMMHGNNGDPIGILPSSLITEPNSDLFQRMQDLFHVCTVFDTDLKNVSDEMIQKFNSRSGGTFTSTILNSKVNQSSALINFLKKFGKILNSNLQIAAGNINNVPTINLGAIRPIFNGLYNKFHGLQILVNDTEFTDIALDNFTIDVSGKWSANVTVTIHDHFGLDKNDALTYQDYHTGFASWWLLQHTRDYIPFETIITVRKQVSGSL
jgi:hypothetical protein